MGKKKARLSSDGVPDNRLGIGSWDKCRSTSHSYESLQRITQQHVYSHLSLAPFRDFTTIQAGKVPIINLILSNTLEATPCAPGRPEAPGWTGRTGRTGTQIYPLQTENDLIKAWDLSVDFLKLLRNSDQSEVTQMFNSVKRYVNQTSI